MITTQRGSHPQIWFGGEIGIHVRLKIECSMHEGSSPSRTTKNINKGDAIKPKEADVARRFS